MVCLLIFVKKLEVNFIMSFIWIVNLKIIFKSVLEKSNSIYLRCYYVHQSFFNIKLRNYFVSFIFFYTQVSLKYFFKIIRDKKIADKIIFNLIQLSICLWYQRFFFNCGTVNRTGDLIFSYLHAHILKFQTIDNLDIQLAIYAIIIWNLKYYYTTNKQLIHSNVFFLMMEPPPQFHTLDSASCYYSN